jgi:DNA-binding MarR family transcriptional regulator
MKLQSNNIDKKIVYLLERVSQVFRALQWEMAKRHKLTPLQIQILLFLKNRKEAIPSQIAQELGLTKATLSESISALEKKKLIRRITNKKDRRFIDILLTLQGKKVVRELISVENVFEHYLSEFSDTDKRNSLKFLLNIISLLYLGGYISVIRLCCTCQHFEKDAIRSGVHFCKLLGKEMSTEEIRINCVSYIPLSTKKGGVNLCC